MAKNLLIVEGESDKHFIQTFIEYEDLGINFDIQVSTAPEVDRNIVHTTKQAVFKSLNTAIKQLDDGSYTRIGILIDMDYTFGNNTPINELNLTQLSNSLNTHGYQLKISPNNDTGIFFENTEFEHPIGVWIMPDNINEGYLEHWLEQSMKDSQNGLYATVKGFIDTFDNNYFKTHVVTKAKVYTWLAVQPKPSQDLSRCLLPSSDLLNKQSTSYQNFKNWLVTTFT